jgi:hypothetical protein
VSSRKGTCRLEMGLRAVLNSVPPHHFRRPRRDTVSFRNAVAVFLTAIGNPDATSLASSYRSEGARPLGETIELGKDTVSLHDLRTCCNWLALRPCLFLKPPLELVPPPGFLLQLLVDFICVPVETSFYMTCNLPSMMPSYPLAF